MEDLSLHILDIAENSVAADADRIEIIIIEDKKKGLLTLEINDNGKGMDEETRKKAMDPFFTSKTTRRFGLGLPLLAAATRAADGDISILSNPKEGTRIKARFSYSHIDRKPLGNINQTILILAMGNPDLNFIYKHIINGRAYCLNTKKIKATFKDKSMNSLEGIKLLKEKLEEMQKKLKSEEKG